MSNEWDHRWIEIFSRTGKKNVTCRNKSMIRAGLNSLLITHYSSKKITNAKIFHPKLAPPHRSQHDLGIFVHFYEIWIKNL